MEKIKVIFVEVHGLNPLDRMVEWPADDTAAEKLFTDIMKDVGQELKFTKRSPWYVDNKGDMIWFLCDRKSGAPVVKLERLERPETTEKNIIIGTGLNKYTYFVSYRINGCYANDIVVMDHPVKDIKDIRKIEWALTSKESTWRPTILNINLLAEPQEVL